MYENFFSIAITLFLVIDAFGNIPVYLKLLSKFEKKVRWKIALRELFFALCIMFIFHYFGEFLLSLLGVTHSVVKIGGGIVLFLIAIRLIFSNGEEKMNWGEAKPFIVPIATPIFAGPSLLAIIMIFSQENPSNWEMIFAMLVAWFFSSIIFFFAEPIFKVVKEKVLSAAQSLMGLIVALIAVEMFLEGIEGVFKHS